MTTYGIWWFADLEKANRLREQIAVGDTEIDGHEEMTSDDLQRAKGVRARREGLALRRLFYVSLLAGLVVSWRWGSGDTSIGWLHWYWDVLLVGGMLGVFFTWLTSGLFEIARNITHWIDGPPADKLLPALYWRVHKLKYHPTKLAIGLHCRDICRPQFDPFAE